MPKAKMIRMLDNELAIGLVEELIREKILAGVRIKNGLLIARYTVNKTTLKKEAKRLSK